MPAEKRNPEKPDSHELTITRTFNAPRVLVWKVWTDPAHIKEWWGPKHFVNAACETDFRVGGRFHLKMCAPDGKIYPCLGIFREIIKPERLVYENDAEHGHPCGAGIPPHSRVTVTFSEHNGKTTLTIHTKFESLERKQAADKERFSISWNEALERLAGSVERS